MAANGRIRTAWRRSSTSARSTAWLSAAFEQASPCDPEWLGSWRLWEERAQIAIAGVLGTDLSEPQLARVVHRHAAESGATLVVAASMPIRDLEWYADTEITPPRVLANRGANGIDGVVSTALGVAAAGPGPGDRTIALLGDLAFLHDVSGLVNVPDLPCTFVVVDNGGGGIFSFLPQAGSLEAATFERLFGTPPTSDLGSGRARVRDSRPRRLFVVRTQGGLELAHVSAPALARGGAGAGAGASRERRPARRDQRGGPSRADVKAGEGVDLETRPVGLVKASSTLASPDIFHPISWTLR